MLAEDVDERGIDPATLEAFAAAMVEGMGVPPDYAAQTAESLVLSDLVGHNSHGVRRIPSYARSARGEREGIYTIDVTATPEIVDEGPTHALVDGRFTLGQVVGRVATDAAIERAADRGMAAVGVRDATHLGRIGEWAARAADAGLLFAAFVNGQGGALVAPPGSAEPRYGTNPLAFGVPTFDALPFPVVLDIATSQVAHGKMGEFAAAGLPLPAAWTITEDGGSVADGQSVVDGEGALLPLGGRAAAYKGFGLAMVAELFAGIVGDGLVVSQSDVIRGNAACFVAIDPTLFTTREALVERVTSLGDYLDDTTYHEAVPAGDAAYGDRGLLPGEPEYRTEVRRRKHGVPIPDADVVSLCEAADELGVEDAIPPAYEAVRSGD